MPLYLKSVKVFNIIKYLLKANNEKIAISSRFLYTNQNKTKWQKNIGDLPGSRSRLPSTKAIESKSKNTKDLIKITLMHNKNFTVTTLEEAKNMANRRSMHLILIKPTDTKSQRPLYKLMSNAELSAEQLSEEGETCIEVNNNEKTTNTKKTEKSLNIGSRISPHDLTLRLKNITKWLTKGHTVRVLIQGATENDKSNCDKIFETIDEYLNGENSVGKIIQKNSKGMGIRFYVTPTAITKTKNTTTTASVLTSTPVLRKTTGKEV